jgi:hypothetical protein
MIPRNASACADVNCRRPRDAIFYVAAVPSGPHEPDWRMRRSHQQVADFVSDRMAQNHIRWAGGLSQLFNPVPKDGGVDQAA